MVRYHRTPSALSTIAVAAVFAASLLGGAASAGAAVITYSATGVSAINPAEAVAATATFTTSAGQIQIALSNDLAPSALVSIGQAISDLSFTLSNNAGSKVSASALGQLGNVTGTTPGIVSYVGGNPGRFIGVGGGQYTVSGADVLLEAIGGGAPTQLILPFVPDTGSYANSNASIANHSPSTIGPATFTLELSGITADTTVTAATFSFGSGPNTFLEGQCVRGCTPRVPEPASLALLGTALAGLGIMRRRRRG